MCKDSKKTPIANDNAPAPRSSAHRLAAVAALSRELFEIDRLRDALDDKREAHEAELGTIEEALAQMEARVAEEAEALHSFDDEYDCGCDGSDGTAPAHSAAYEDEENEPAHARPADSVAPRRSGGALSTLFGALGVAFAVASLVFRPDDSRTGE